jgi:serine/threonine protein phosphatase PrpC
MVTCPKCKAENRPEAAFCSRCGMILFAQPAISKPAERNIDDVPVPQPLPLIPIEQFSAPIAAPTEVPEIDEPAPQVFVGLQRQPVGSLIGNRFRYDSLLSQDEHENRYTVTETILPGSPSVRMCSNPECHTIHCPVDQEPEKFCTQCGYPLDDRPLLFLLQETDTDKFSYIKHVMELNLVHPNIFPPIAAFQQDLAGSTHYYLATPFSDDLPTQPEISEVLRWGTQLAEALDYLQSKGVIFGDKVDSSCIGIFESKAVWRNFTSVRILPMLTDREKINNMRSLVMAMYSIMTGKNEYSQEPYLPAELNSLFEKVLIGEGVTNGAELIQQIELAKKGGLERLVLDFQVGRRSNPGKVRTLNEDSLLSIEHSTIQQGTIRPCGLFAIADGMGGHAAGDLASSLVINTIAKKAMSEIVALQKPEFENYTDWLKDTVQRANQAVYEAREKAGNDMGSTLVLCLLIGSQAYLTHQGDSRAYLVNQDNIQQLTTDHSLVQHMVSTGQISVDEARFHPQRNVIYRSLGDKTIAEVDCISQQLFPHDRLLLCSDGLTNLLNDTQLHEIVMHASSPQVACDRLIEAANSAGGEDNISVILIEVITV